MFPDYKAQVTLAYKKKSAAGMLSLNLLHSTPAKLRAECVMVLNERYLKKDEPALRVFFGPRDDAAGYMQAIRKFDADKFKPLDNFLKGSTTDTEDKNIELLAWLINFEPRPYKFGQVNTPRAIEDNKSVTDIESKTTDKEIKDWTLNLAISNVTDVKRDNYDKQPLNLKGRIRAAREIKTLIILFSIVAFTGAGIYLILHYKIKKNAVVHTVIIGKQKCMYWAGDNYQSIPCDQKLGDTPIFALDTFKLTHFKRITRPDTISVSSLGKFWYFKTGDTLQVYNSPGIHPVFTDRRLLPLTKRMLNKYILHITAR